MAKRQAFLLRLPPEILEELRRWAAQEMRSVNGQMEYVLRSALRARGVRVPDATPPAPTRTKGGRSER